MITETPTSVEASATLRPGVRPQKLLLARPRGFCAGVDRAIEVVNMALELFPGPIYVRKQIVHNRHVIESFLAKGVIFVDEISEVPDGALVIFSAHGVSPEVRAGAAARGLRVIDATCPLVTKVHFEAVRFRNEGRSIILVGHKGHEEVAGTMGEVPGHVQLVGTPEEAERVEVLDPDRVAVVTQTTLGVDDANAIIDVLRRRFPKLATPSSDDICYATQNRQTSVKSLAKRAGLVLVLGSDNSSNSQRLREVAEDCGARAYLIDDASEIDPGWLEGIDCVGVTAGASAPEHLVEAVVGYFMRLGVTEVEEVEAVQERVTFAPPAELARAMAGR
ncbi:MAG TPA: 4-hydroxy-3-methylbut-2-enyl diphosphate reductase [Terriglobia bacterium]|nr:4-hydroxy-3-methylbut-2-enyl diphosphate reductase [Terriglobia bacterium]